jgi:hypothetical protein
MRHKERATFASTTRVGLIQALEPMTNLVATFSVVLRSDLPPLERELFSHFCSRITSDTNGDLLQFSCTKIDASHHFYLLMDTFKNGDTETHPIQIPHHFVFLISGEILPTSIGFTK